MVAIMEYLFVTTVISLVIVIYKDILMTIYAIVLISFLVSLFIGSKAVCIGLGIVVGMLTIILHLDRMGWLD